MSLGTSPLLPSGRKPPFVVTKATRGEGVGRCSAHAQYSFASKGHFLVQRLLSVIQAIYRHQIVLYYNNVDLMSRDVRSRNNENYKLNHKESLIVIKY